MGIVPTDTLLVHSSMKSIGQVENGAETVLDTLSEYLSGGLLIMPTHTWGYINAESPVFDVRTSKSCVGVLTELFRHRTGVIRSLHPTHSVAALGSDAKSYVSGEELLDTPCAPKSCYGKLEGRDAKILMIGVNFAKNTTIHCIEEVAGVPGRLSDHQEQLYTVDYDGRKIGIPCFRHDNADSYHYMKLEPVMFSRGVLHETRFGDAKCLLLGAKDLFGTTLELLSKNIRLFDDFEPVPTKWY